ncbi:ACP S-malonyltransferase [bacterium]|nr:ACP S-malonyltransferase [bacterium]
MSFAMIFPGQGSQSVGMLQNLLTGSTAAQEAVATASEATGLDIASLMADGPADQLNATEMTQPVLVAADAAVWAAWCDQTDARPAVLAGHSLGEYPALVAAGCLQLADAARLAQLRGQAMRDAAPDGAGAMAAVIGLDDDGVRKLCAAQAEGQVLEAVNFNAPGQVVIAGDAAAVERAIAAARPAGARLATRIPVSVPAHSSLMRPAADALRAALADVELVAPCIPVIHNVTAEPTDNPEQIRSWLIEQLYNPVQWVASVQAMTKRGARTFLECGPGKVLCGLSKRIDRSHTAMPLGEPDQLAAAIESVSN